MKWYKQLPDYHPAMQPAINAFAWEGKGIMDKLYQLVQENGFFELTEEILKRNFGFNSRKTKRMFPILSECFAKLSPNIAKDSNVSPNFDDISESFVKLEGQKPSGRNNILENRIDRIEENREIKKKNFSDEKESEQFLQFWSAYPKKVTKQESIKYWRKNNLDNLLLPILEGLEAWKTSEQWQDKKFIPDAIRFLSKSRWEDEVPQKAEKVEQQNDFDEWASKYY